MAEDFQVITCYQSEQLKTNKAEANRSECQDYSRSINQTCLSEPLFVFFFVPPCASGDGLWPSARLVQFFPYAGDTKTLYHWTQPLRLKMEMLTFWLKNKYSLLHHIRCIFYSPAFWFSFVCYTFLCVHGFFFPPQECICSCLFFLVNC